MARKKRKRTGRRRKRIGAFGKSDLASVFGVIAGTVIAKQVAKILPLKDNRIKNAAVLGIGIAFPMLLKGDLGKSLGTGMVAAGGAGLLGQLVPQLGQMDDTMTFPVTVGEVPDTVSVIAGDDDVMAGDNLSVLAGMDDDDC